MIAAPRTSSAECDTPRHHRTLQDDLFQPQFVSTVEYNWGKSGSSSSGSSRSRQGVATVTGLPLDATPYNALPTTTHVEFPPTEYKPQHQNRSIKIAIATRPTLATINETAASRPARPRSIISLGSSTPTSLFFPPSPTSPLPMYSSPLRSHGGAGTRWSPPDSITVPLSQQAQGQVYVDDSEERRIAPWMAWADVNKEDHYDAALAR